ncbi:MAG: hypothetical protein ACOZIN_05720 [Myxococcota bacterium]
MSARGQRNWLLAAGAGAVALVFGCRGENSLYGSVDELFSLEVARVEIRRNHEAFQVSYFNNRGANLDVVARVAVSLQDVDFVPGTKIDLSGEYAPGHPRAAVIHEPGGEPARVFPRVKKGDLVLSSGGNPDELTRGDFSVLFEESGGDIGGGRTLGGSFSAIALDAGFGPLP